MKDTRNVTLALPVALLRRVKRLAADRETSVSALLTAALSHEVGRAERYDAARRQHLAALRRTRDLGTGGRPSWTRDSLHERS